MKSLLLFITATYSLQYLSAVVPSQAVSSLPPLKSLWHPNLYLAKDDEDKHYEIRHTGTPYTASLSFLQQPLSDVMNCKCRFESRGSAPGPGSFLQQKGKEVTESMQEEATRKPKAVSTEIPLSPRKDVESVQPASTQAVNAQVVPDPAWAAPAQLFQQTPQMFMYVPMMLPQTQYFTPQGFAPTAQSSAIVFLPRQ